MFAKHKLSLLLPAVLLAPASYAEELSYTFGQIDYINVDGEVGNVDLEGDGIGLSGAFSVAENFFLLASYSKTDLDFRSGGVRGNVDFDTFSFGGGAHFPIAKDFDLVGTLRYVRVDVENQDDDGVGLSVGLRNFATPQIEWAANINYTDLDSGTDNGDFSFGGEGRFHFTPQLSLGVGIDVDEDFDVFTYNVGLRAELR